MKLDMLTEDMSVNLFHSLFGRFWRYRRFIGGTWRYSDLTCTWWKIRKIKHPIQQEEVW